MLKTAHLHSPIMLAILVTVFNTIKPVTIDDTAYLIYARHIDSNPFDPYGFDVFWWSHPEPAMQVLAPPVLPYWLALGISLFGESPMLLKLWLFPFVLLLAWALRTLLRRFAPGTAPFALPLLMLSSAVLPTVNLMLDIPAVALSLTSLAIFVSITQPTAWRAAVAAGVVAGLAIQTKYTALVLPAILAGYGLTHRRLRLAIVSILACGVVFAGWELWLLQHYGESHFWHHAHGSASIEADGTSRIAAFLESKRGLISPLSSHFGCLAVGAGLLSISQLRIPRLLFVMIAGVWCLGFLLIAVLPHRWTVIEGDATATAAFWQFAGMLWMLGIAIGAANLLFRTSRGLGIRYTRDTWFLIGWLLLELASTLVLTPFPAARRVIGLALVAGLIAARFTSRIRRIRRAEWMTRLSVLIGIASGVAVAVIDTIDAFPEKRCAEQAIQIVQARQPSATVWYAGHWGFQYYCEQAGMKHLVPGVSVVRAGDFVVLPIYPDQGFHRPYAGYEVKFDPTVAGDQVIVTDDDWLSARTVPNFYGGLNPIEGRDHPRLQVRVFRSRTTWVWR